MLHEYSGFRISFEQEQVVKNALHMSKTSTKTIQESETKSKLNRYQILDFQIELIMTLCQLRKSAIQFLYQAQCCLFYTECSAIDNQLFLS